MLVFDPIQLKSFGHEFYETESFSVRYVLSNKLFFKSIYIPYGPIIKTERGFSEFIEFLIKYRFNKVKIDLPKIYDKDLEERFIDDLKKNGFRKSQYIQDSETLMLTPQTWDLSSRYKRYVRSTSKDYTVKIYENLSKSIDDEFSGNTLIRVLYDIYKNNGKQLRYNIKPYQTFWDTFNNSITSIVYSNTRNEICGFVMGYKYNKEVIDNLESNELLLLFTALTEEGKENRLGYLIHEKLFEHVFNELRYSQADFHGADRSKKRSYIDFKERFGGTFVSYPGSFEKIKLF